MDWPKGQYSLESQSSEITLHTTAVTGCRTVQRNGDAITKVRDTTAMLSQYDREIVMGKMRHAEWVDNREMRTSEMRHARWVEVTVTWARAKCDMLNGWTGP